MQSDIIDDNSIQKTAIFTGLLKPVLVLDTTITSQASSFILLLKVSFEVSLKLQNLKDCCSSSQATLLVQTAVCHDGIKISGVVRYH